MPDMGGWYFVNLLCDGQVEVFADEWIVMASASWYDSSLIVETKTF